PAKLLCIFLYAKDALAHAVSPGAPAWPPDRGHHQASPASQQCISGRIPANKGHAGVLAVTLEYLLVGSPNVAGHGVAARRNSPWALALNIASSSASSSCPEVSSCCARYWHACHGVNGKSLP